MFKWILIVLGALLLLGCIMEGNKGGTGSGKRASQDIWMNENGIKKTADYYFSRSGDLIMARFVVDDEHEKIYYSLNTEALSDLPYSEILGCETFCNDVNSGGVGRAVAGAVIAGGIGAIVGATTTKTKIESYYMLIYTRNIAEPKIKLDLITTTTEKDTIEFRDAVAFSEGVTATIKAILSKSEN